MGLASIDYAASTGRLRELYDAQRARPQLAHHRPPRGEVANIVVAHSLDPELIPRVFDCAATLGDAGPLSPAERELIYTASARLNQCTYQAARHADRLRRAGASDALVRAVLADPRALATNGSDARLRMIVELTALVAGEPWTLSRQHLSRAYTASLSDEDILQVVMLAAFAGHLDRIAAAVGIAHDGDTNLDVPATDLAAQIAHDGDTNLDVPATDLAAQVWANAPKLVAGRPAIDPARRPATQAALAEWRSYVFYRDTPISRRARTLLARWVAMWLGDGGISPPTDLTANPHDDVLRTFAEVITLSPWQLDESHLVPLRAASYADEAVFDACATVTAAGVFSRIEVALAALGA